MFLDRESTIKVWFTTDGVESGEEKPTNLEVEWPADCTLDELKVEITKILNTECIQESDTSFVIHVPNTNLNIKAYTIAGNSLYIVPDDAE